MVLGGSCFAQDQGSSLTAEHPHVLAQMLDLQNMFTANVVSVDNDKSPSQVQNSTQKSNPKGAIKAVHATMEVSPETQTQVQNAFVYKVEDSKSVVAKTKPIEKQEATPEMVNAMKAAFGIDN